MKTAIQLIVFISILGLYSCETCDDDIVVADFELSEIAKSYLPDSPMDTLIYTNDSIDIKIYTKRGKKLEDDSTSLLNICQIGFTQQWERATTEKEYIEYFFDAEEIAFEFGVNIHSHARGNHEELTTDSVYIWEQFYLRLNNDSDEFIDSYHNRTVNNVQRDWIANSSPSTRIITDTILNNKSYADLIARVFPQHEEFYYSKTDGIVAFEKEGEIWYLK